MWGHVRPRGYRWASPMTARTGLAPDVFAPQPRPAVRRWSAVGLLQAWEEPASALTRSRRRPAARASSQCVARSAAEQTTTRHAPRCRVGPHGPQDAQPLISGIRSSSTRPHGGPPPARSAASSGAAADARGGVAESRDHAAPPRRRRRSRPPPARTRSDPAAWATASSRRLDVLSHMRGDIFTPDRPASTPSTAHAACAARRYTPPRSSAMPKSRRRSPRATGRGRPGHARPVVGAASASRVAALRGHPTCCSARPRPGRGGPPSVPGGPVPPAPRRRPRRAPGRDRGRRGGGWPTATTAATCSSATCACRTAAGWS